MTKDKIPQTAKEINFDDAILERQEVPYFQVPNSAIDEEGNLTSYELLIYLVLCRYGNRGKAAFPSYETMARKAAISRRSVARALNGLLDKGYIVKKNRAGSSNVYLVKMEVVPQGHGVVSEGHGLPVSEGHARKNNLFINKKEREPRSNNSQVKEAVKHYQQLKEGATVNQRDRGTIAGLIKQHNLETILQALTLHVNEPDQWTRERGSSISTINHNMPAYLERIRKTQAAAEKEERQRAAIRAQQQREAEEDRQREEERAKFEALPAAEQARIKRARRREMLELLIEVRRPIAAEGCKESAAKLQEYETELAEINQAELKQAREA